MSSAQLRALDSLARRVSSACPIVDREIYVRGPAIAVGFVEAIRNALAKNLVVISRMVDRTPI